MPTNNADDKRLRKEIKAWHKQWMKEHGRTKIRHEDGVLSFTIFDNTEVSEGGALTGKWMTAHYMNRMVNKWVRQCYETGKEQPDYDWKNQWVPHQCEWCRWFAAFDNDYGLCFCESGSNEGKVVFEHGGCGKHSSLYQQNTL